MRKLFMFAVPLVILVCSTVSASAGIMYMDVYDPTVMGYSGPTPTKCYAFGDLNQQCRSCLQAFDRNGQEIGFTCAYVASSEACTCDKQANCTKSVGSCTYY